jgi:hypothetical protein
MTGRTIDLKGVADLLERLERRSTANESPPSLKRDCDLAVHLIRALLQRASIQDWPISL